MAVCKNNTDFTNNSKSANFSSNGTVSHLLMHVPMNALLDNRYISLANALMVVDIREIGSDIKNNHKVNLIRQLNNSAV